MTDEATQDEGAELNQPAPGSIDHAAQQINGLLSTDADEPKKKPTEEAEEETEEQQTPEDEEHEDTDPDSEADEQLADEEQVRPLTSLSDITEQLGVDEDALMDIKIMTKVDGVEEEATLAQLIKERQLERHVNRKSMELSDQKKEIEKERETIQAERDQKLKEIEHATQIANQLLAGEYQSIDWEKLRKEDSVEYLEKKAQFEEYGQHLSQLSNLIKQEQQKETQAQQEKLKAYVEDQQKKLVNAVPEWKDQNVLKKDYSELVDFLRDDFGVTKEELNGILDHRFYLMARDAKRYRELQKRNPRAEKRDRKTGKPAKPGARKTPEASRKTEISEHKKRFNKARDVQSAGALINALAKR